jgi:hypothetical protein
VKFPTFYGTQRFITVFTRACHWFISLVREDNIKINFRETVLEGVEWILRKALGI